MVLVGGGMVVVVCRRGVGDKMLYRVEVVEVTVVLVGEVEEVVVVRSHCNEIQVQTHMLFPGGWIVSYLLE